MRSPRLTTIVRMLAVIGLLSSPLSAAEKLSLSSLFTDHAVLQRDMAVPVWGKAEPESEVTVEFAGQSKSAKAGPDGKWIVRLDPLPASSEPRDLVVQSTIKNRKLPTCSSARFGFAAANRTWAGR